MKVWIAKWAVAALMLLGVTGCGMGASPVDLLKAPSTSKSLLQIKQAVESFLPAGSSLTIAMVAKQTTGSIYEEDLDGDGTSEAVALYRNERNNFEQGALVLKQVNGVWQKWDDLKELTPDIHYIDFQDVTGDGNPDLLIGWGSADPMTERTLSVYAVRSGQLAQIGKMSYSEIAVDDFDLDRTADIMLFHASDSSAPRKASVELYQWSGMEIYLADKKAVDISVNSFSDVSVGKATATRTAVFAEALLGAHSSYTGLFVAEKGRLKEIFPLTYAGSKTFKAYPTLSKDINGDGIVEIDLLREPADSSGVSMAEMPWIHDWYQWDGDKGLLPVFQNYYDYNAGFQFDFPMEWYNRITIKRTGDQGKDTTFYMLTKDKAVAELLTIRAIDNAEWDAARTAFEAGGIEYETLMESDETNYVAVWPQSQPSQLSDEELADYNRMKVQVGTTNRYFRSMLVGS